MRTIIRTLYVVAATIAIVPEVQADDPPAEQIPANFREYFRRIDESIAKLREELPKDIANLEAAIAAEGDPKQKVELRMKVAAIKKRLVQVQQGSYRPTIPFEDSKQDSIGVFLGRLIVEVVDEDTSIALGPKMHWIIDKQPTKRMRRGKEEKFDTLFRVVTPRTTATGKARDAGLSREIPIGNPYCVIEPVKPRDLGKYRAMYEAEKQTAAEKAADENPAQK